MNESLTKLYYGICRHLDFDGILHRFDDCYSYDETNSVMLFTILLPSKKYISKLNFIPDISIITKVNVLESSVPNLYYLELIFPNFE